MRKLIMLVPFLLLAACGGKTVYHYDDEADPNRVTSVEKQRSFWESDNLANHYDFLDRHQQVFVADSQAKANMLITLHNSAPYQTKTEEVLGSILTARMITDLRYIQPNVRQPETMTTFWRDAFPSWANLVLNVSDRVWPRETRSGSPSIENRDGTVIYASSFDQEFAEGVEFGSFFRDNYRLKLEGEGNNLTLDQSETHTSDDDRTTSIERNNNTSTSGDSDAGLF